MSNQASESKLRINWQAIKVKWSVTGFAFHISHYCNILQLSATSLSPEESCIGCLYVEGWMDELGFYVPSTVFHSFRDDGRVNMKGSVQ